MLQRTRLFLLVVLTVPFLVVGWPLVAQQEEQGQFPPGATSTVPPVRETPTVSPRQEEQGRFPPGATSTVPPRQEEERLPPIPPVRGSGASLQDQRRQRERQRQEDRSKKLKPYGR
jgi:hypothetical protein